jgi:hypothetical protein
LDLKAVIWFIVVDNSRPIIVENTKSTFERRRHVRAQRDSLVAQIIPLLEAAQFKGTPIPDSTAQSLIQQAQELLSSVQTYASSL